MAYNENSFPLRKGNVGLTTGIHTGTILLCIEEGSVTFTWKDGGTYTETMIQGLSYDLLDCASITINSGIFHIG